MELKFEDLDSEGFENLLIGMVSLAREDYVKGYRKIMDRFGRILTEDEFNKWYRSTKTHVDSFIQSCRAYYSAIRFVEKDPYDLFMNKNEEILSTWKELAIESYEEYKLKNC